LLPSDTVLTGEGPSLLCNCRYSHRHLAALGYTASNVEEVRFFCSTSAHSRVMHFKTSNPHVLEVAFTGDHRGQNSPSHWNTNWSALDGHSAYLPAATDAAYSDDSSARSDGRRDALGFANFPFFRPNAYHWGVRGLGSRWECDDWVGSQHTTLHQVWVRQGS
jgi:hypothetical protein